MTTQQQYDNAVERYMNLFERSIRHGITFEEKSEMETLEKEIRSSKFFK